MNIIFAVAFIFSFLCKSQCSSRQLSPNVYWRDYTGIVPDDAVSGGYDVNGMTTYIGQAFVKNIGIFPGVIHAGVKQMTVPAYGTKVVDAYVKILCASNPATFKWVPTTTNNFHMVAENNFLVKGGEENGHTLNIGRVAFQGEVITGKIFTGNQGKAPLYFAYKNREIKMESYEVLIFDPSFSLTPPTL